MAMRSSGDVVLHPALLALLYGGDPYLAANIETLRVVTSGRLQDQGSMDFFVRLHDSTSRLNPCHEDSYYVANAFLTWGGALSSAEKVIERAGACRFWDPWPVFMHGFNQYFFSRNIDVAVASMNEASRRSSGKEADFFATLAISFRAASMDDLSAAIRYLKMEESRTKDHSMKIALAKRIGRLEGLAILRSAQKEYERRHQKPLRSPSDLLHTRVLREFPVDPLGLGYAFNNGIFELKQLTVTMQGQ